MINKKVVIVIPSYKIKFTRAEELSFLHMQKFLPNYDKYFVLPDRLKTNKILRKGFKQIFMPSRYFANISNYCELINTEIFYTPFKKYKYLLLHQTDVLVFSNKLNYWCNKNYDYIGAPFINPVIGKLTYPKDTPVSGGNGGFSLRKISTALKVLENVNKLARRKTDNLNLRKLWFIFAVIFGQSHKKWLKSPAYCYPFNEDGFWSYEAPKYLKGYKVAPYKDALAFAFEKEPVTCFKKNKDKLPFGAHAWEKYDKQFWSKYLLKKL